MAIPTIPAGTVHDKLPADVLKVLAGDQVALDVWHDISPLARNEWICWVEGAKLIETRARRVERVASELAEGIRRPCCWPGCMHRTDKALSPTQQWVLNKQSKKN